MRIGYTHSDNLHYTLPVLAWVCNEDSQVGRSSCKGFQKTKTKEILKI